MLVFYGLQPPTSYHTLRVGGQCPNCNKGTSYRVITTPDYNKLYADKINQFVISYACDICSAPIPVKWTIRDWHAANNPIVGDPKEILPVKEPFDFSHVPGSVAKEINEALDCLSVSAYNGFAACCRRAVQSLCTALGADATTKVKQQIADMAAITELGADWQDLALQVMLAGHDGAHPHLPEMDSSRASAILPLLQDLTYQLFTRPGNVKQAAELRKNATTKK